LDFWLREEEGKVTSTQVYSDNQDFFNANEKPDCSLILQPNSALVMTKKSYFDYAHGIVPKDEDTVDEHIANFKLTGLSSGTKLKRAPRVSIVLWPGDQH